MRKAAEVEIIIIGNEILTGDILDTNTNWLCQLVHGRGGVVTRVTVIPDILSVVAEAVREAVSRTSGIVFTSGGLLATVSLDSVFQLPKSVFHNLTSKLQSLLYPHLPLHSHTFNICNY